MRYTLGNRGKKWDDVGHPGAQTLNFPARMEQYEQVFSFWANMFLGEFRHTIDEKGRLTIPAKYRGLLANGMVVTRGFDRNLMAFSLEGWEELAERIKSLPISDPSAREFRRRVFSGAINLVPDRQGRMLLRP